MDWTDISRRIASASGQAFKAVRAQPLAGGDINSAFRLQGEDKAYFVKLNRVDRVTMFESEFEGLQELAGTQTLRVPQPLVCGQTNEYSFLVLDYLEFGRSDKASDRLLGRQLALMHRQAQPYFGWRRDNIDIEANQAT